MPALTRLNRILLVWLLILAGVALGPARSLASCDMDVKTQAASAHACCIKKAVCACETPASDALHQATHPGAAQGVCSCAAHPQPVNSAPQAQPLRWYTVAALPTRAGPLVSFAAPAAAPLARSEPAAFFYRFVSPSPPRAPPFRA